jgi:hypothetical protein
VRNALVGQLHCKGRQSSSFLINEHHIPMSREEVDTRKATAWRHIASDGVTGFTIPRWLVMTHYYMNASPDPSQRYDGYGLSLSTCKQTGTAVESASDLNLTI